MTRSWRCTPCPHNNGTATPKATPGPATKVAVIAIRRTLAPEVSAPAVSALGSGGSGGTGGASAIKTGMVILGRRGVVGAETNDAVGGWTQRHHRNMGRATTHSRGPTGPAGRARKTCRSHP